MVNCERLFAFASGYQDLLLNQVLSVRSSDYVDVSSDSKVCHTRKQKPNLNHDVSNP